jgi:nucleotide-binding universal stress UspA family protein
MAAGAASSLLVCTDFSAAARAAASRAALIAKACGGMRGTLAHVLGAAPAGYEAPVAQAAQRALGELAAEIEANDGLALEPRLLRGNPVDQLARAAAGFDLTVAGARGEHALLDFVLGRTSERLARDLSRPLLLVKGPASGAYRRVLVAVDFSPSSGAAARAAAALAPQAELQLVHAFEVEFESTLRFAGVADDQVHKYRQEARERATVEMEAFISALGLPAARVSRLIAHGFPARVVEEAAQAQGAELVALGRGRSGLERLLLGSVALRVLEITQCDVLLVPER